MVYPIPYGNRVVTKTSEMHRELLRSLGNDLQGSQRSLCTKLNVPQKTTGPASCPHGWATAVVDVDHPPTFLLFWTAWQSDYDWMMAGRL